MAKLASRSKFLLSVFALAAVTTGTQAKEAASPDLFLFAEDNRILEAPEGTGMSQMDSSPLNLVDDSVATDWTDEAGAAVFVFELAELTELHRIAFDTGGLNRGIKSAKEFVVEVSETSATKSFTEVLGGTLKMAKNGQSFSFKPEERPTAQWVRLTICASSHAGLARADHRFFGSTAENQRRGRSIFKKSPIAAVMGKVWVRWTSCAKRSFTIIMRA